MLHKHILNAFRRINSFAYSRNLPFPAYLSASNGIRIFFHNVDSNRLNDRSDHFDHRRLWLAYSVIGSDTVIRIQNSLSDPLSDPLLDHSSAVLDAQTLNYFQVLGVPNLSTLLELQGLKPLIFKTRSFLGQLGAFWLCVSSIFSNF